MSKFWRSLILSLFILVVFVAVELTWVVDSLFYHWFTFASTGIVLVAVPLAWPGYENIHYYCDSF